jgi:lysozyme
MAAKRKYSKKYRSKLAIVVIFTVLILLLLVSLPEFRSRIGLIFYHPTEEQVSLEYTKKKLSNFNMFGLDVSQYQNVIVWRKLVNNENIKFVFIRASAGDNLMDKYFTYNWRESKQQNLVRGAYHYYRPDENSLKQAENFIKHVKLENGDLPPILDIEDYSDVQSLNSLKTGLLKWLRRVEANYSVKPIIYTYYKYYDLHFKDDKRFNDYEFWLARYGNGNKYVAPGKEWVFWQYTKHGKMEGIQGDVDMNVFYGNEEDFKELLIQ